MAISMAAAEPAVPAHAAPVAAEPGGDQVGHAMARLVSYFSPPLTLLIVVRIGRRQFRPGNHILP